MLASVRMRWYHVGCCRIRMTAQYGRCHQLVRSYKLTGTLIATASSTHHQHHLRQAKEREMHFDSTTDKLKSQPIVMRLPTRADAIRLPTYPMYCSRPPATPPGQTGDIPHMLVSSIAHESPRSTHIHSKICSTSHAATNPSGCLRARLWSKASQRSRLRTGRR